MTKYDVISPEMWGHVSVDCSVSYGCKCVTLDDDGASTHDDNRCDCGESENDRHKVGTIEVPEESTDDAIVQALFDAGYLSEKGRSVAKIDDFTDGTAVDVLDAEGRKLFCLETEEG